MADRMVTDASRLVFEVYDPSFTLIGLCDMWEKLEIALRHCGPGGWTLSLPATSLQAGLFSEGSRVAVWDDWNDDIPLMSGTVTGLTTSSTSGDTPIMLTVAGVDDTALLADRLVMPVPDADMNDQGDAAEWTYTGKAEGAIRSVVDANAGEGSYTGRRICDADPDDRLAVPESLYGSTRKVSSRFDNLLTLVGDLASIDNLAVKLYQPRGVADLYLDVAPTTDKSAGILLSFGAGTLTGASASVMAPTATNVLVAGGGEGEARVLVHRYDSALITEWSRRIEVFRDARDTSDLTILAERGDEALAGARSTAGLVLDPVDLPNQSYGVDYKLGDTVRVDIGGMSWTDIVSAVNIVVTAENGMLVTPVVGDPEPDTKTPTIYRKVRDVLRRLEALERRY